MVDIEKLRALLAAATPRPWLAAVWYGTDDGGWAAIGPHCVASEADGFDDAPETPSYDQAHADAALIVGAVNALPELLDEIERLRARKAEVCDCVHATGMIGDTFVYVEDDCPRCGGVGAVMVEGGRWVSECMRRHMKGGE